MLDHLTSGCTAGVSLLMARLKAVLFSGTGTVVWTHPAQLVELDRFYARARRRPETVSDEEFLAAISEALWPTNCWSFVEQAFAIIAPGCALRPHLVRPLIAIPINAMIAGGLDDPGQVMTQGIACATKKELYVEPTEEGKKWLLDEWPTYAAVAEEVFWELWRDNLQGDE